MSEYYGRILGEIPPTCHKDKYYFDIRFCFVDCRGPLVVHANAFFGIGVKIITTGHNLSNWPEFGPMINKPVEVGDGAWIGSFALLHNCRVMPHAIVSAGAVVNGITVPEYAVVVGNPAKVVGYMYKGVVVSYDKWLEHQKDEGVL